MILKNKSILKRIVQQGSILLLISVLLVACSAARQEATPTTVLVYKPPTQDPAVLQLQETEAAKLTVESLPTPTPKCTSGLKFLDDITIEDGSIVSPKDRLDKRWLVENIGSCNWDQDYEIRLVAGPVMGVPSTQALYPALSGTEVEVRMVFTAPDEPGSYRSAWQAYDPDGNPFGETFFIDIVVAQE